MEKSKILLITSRADEGGGPKQILQILRYLKDEYKFYIASPDGETYSSDFKKYSADFINIPHRSFNLQAFLRLLYFTRVHNIKVIHSHGFGAGIYSRLLGLFTFKVIHTFHGLHFKNNLLSKIKIQLEKSLSHLTSHSISVSKSENNRLSKIGLNSIVIENGLESFEINKVKTKNLNNTIEILGVISRLDPHKNIEWVIKNFSLLSRTLNPDLVILVAGEGEQESELKDLASSMNLSSRIKFIGFQDKYDFFEKVDVLLFPSLGEGLPYTILEAMSYQVPIIASRVDGHTDLLDNCNLFDFDNFSFNKKQLTKNLQVYRYKVLRKYNIHKMCDNLKSIYNN